MLARRGSHAASRTHIFRRLLAALGALLLMVATVPLLAGTATATDTQQITAKALADHECNTAEWHFVITQLRSDDDAPASITVSWANGETETVPLDKVTGGTAHYATVANLDSNVTSATADIYAGWSGQFNLSHGPCGDSGPPPGESGSPTGTVNGECSDSSHFYVSGTTDDDGVADVSWRLDVAGGTPIPVSGNTFRVQVDAPVGTVVTLQYRVGNGPWTSTDQSVAVGECPALGSFTVQCADTGALVDLSRLYRGSNDFGRFELMVNGTGQLVTSGQQDIAVPGGATLVLRYLSPSGQITVLDEDTAPAACPTTPAEQRGLNLVKSVSPTGPSTVGATLTYALVVTTTGNAAQTGVTVSDVLAGYAAGTTSGKTTYVAGSATCAGPGTCTTSYDPATHQVTWGLGTMPAGSNRTVSFQVTIDRPTPAADGSIAVFDVVNVGVVSSQQVPATSSNVVITPVAAVLGVKVGQPTTSGGATPDTGVKGSGAGQDTGRGQGSGAVQGSSLQVLPHTGSTSLVLTLGLAVLLILVGGGLLSVPAVRKQS